MTISRNKYISTWKIKEYLRTDVATKFPQIHAAIGHDTTFFSHVIVKIKVSQWKRKIEVSKHKRCFMQSSRHHS